LNDVDTKLAEPTKERGGIQSIERAFAILEEVARHRDGIGLAELSKRVGLHSSTAFHLVRTMVQLGYVSQPRDSKKYRVGRRLFTLAAGALDDVELVRIATPILEKLSLETSEASHFAVRSGDEIVVVAKTAGGGMFQLVDRSGAVRPAHATALGKVLAAAMTPSELERYLQTHELRRFTPKTTIERDALLRGTQAELHIVFGDSDVAADGVAFVQVELSLPVACFLGEGTGLLRF